MKLSKSKKEAHGDRTNFGKYVNKRYFLKQQKKKIGQNATMDF